jgi:hypothetical protein
VGRVTPALLGEIARVGQRRAAASAQWEVRSRLIERKLRSPALPQHAAAASTAILSTYLRGNLFLRVLRGVRLGSKSVVDRVWA